MSIPGQHPCEPAQPRQQFDEPVPYRVHWIIHAPSDVITSMRGIFFHWRGKSSRTAGAAVMLGLLAGCGPAFGQVSVPALPEVPGVDGILRELEQEADRLPVESTRSLREARRRLVNELLRRHRSELERGPRGEAIVRGEVTAFSPSESGLAAARRAGFSVVRDVSLDALGARVVVMRAPAGESTRRALRRLAALDPDGTYDFNHLYLPGGVAAVTDVAGGEAERVASDVAASGVRIGLVDGGIALDHPALAGATIQSHGCEGSQVASAHGTAVASLLVGAAGSFRGAAPGGTLYAADVYCGRATGGAVDAFAEALAWLAGEGVAVINTSIVGPPNRILEGVVRALSDRGHVIVAAVGNDGPAARPLYPAAYAGAVGVTGVNARRRVLPEAGRGAHVDFAAPGAEMLAAGIGDPYAEVRGTSFAAPLVAGLLAGMLDRPDPEEAQAAIAGLAGSAVDLGRRGRDDVFGHGLVAENLRSAP